MPGASGARPVRDMNGARRAAQRFADGWGRGLRVGEVMQFSNGFYAVLLDPSGEGATEVLVDPASGAVQLEHGPAMMWNTSYGMMPDRQQQAAPAVSAERAQVVADRWLKQNRAGLKAADPVAFPGYYTFHTLRGDQVVGMMSVNAYNGAVWYHTWHGTFLRMQEPRHS
ncbi:hypothetical protein EF879_00360 [Micromonospora sp. HM5-17]|nr:hypothetical protein EF879_00360 [Micromonospora sp. HM5-17]